MNIYEKKQIHCSVCGTFVGEVEIESSVIFPLCKKCDKKEKTVVRKGISKILVPVDISNKSKKALDAAIYLSKHLGAAITVTHVMPTVKVKNRFFLKNIFDEINKTAELSVKFAKDYCDKRNVVARQLIVRGDEPEQIIKTAKKYHHDLIIMGSSGKGAFKELVFGSISNYVMQNSNIPVLIVKETSAKFDTTIDKKSKKTKKNSKPFRQGGGKSFAKMKKEVGLK